MGSPSTLLAEPMYGEDLSPKYAGHLCKVTDGPILKKKMNSPTQLWLD